MGSLLESGDSVYHRWIASFVRRPDGAMLQVSGPARLPVIQAWDVLRTQLHSPHEHLTQPKAKRILSTSLGCRSKTSTQDIPGGPDLLLLERSDSSTTYIFGVLVEASLDIPLSADLFVLGLVLHGWHVLGPVLKEECALSRQIEIAEQITRLFDSTLRYVSKDDKWSITGRDFFQDRVINFIRRGLPVEFCLPAFPCKSSNPDKVGGRDPDRGEHIALTTLHNFAKAIEGIYSPGATIIVISDGHVFSDCIGVDDGEVDRYGVLLQRTNDAIIAADSSPRRRVYFKSLVELLHLENDEIAKDVVTTQSGFPPVEHYLDVQLDHDVERRRRILMRGFKADTATLRSRIQEQDGSILALYRGFSRFMLEDLENNPYTKALSKSQRRKVASKVAFEMIERNQAYSNLVEMLFPDHVRLSIHAHDNSGPKFGISMMGLRVKAIASFQVDGTSNSHDLLHIPTPWHNCIVQIEGDEVLYLTKARNARVALQSSAFEGEWQTKLTVETGAGEAAVIDGGYYCLRRRTSSLHADTALIVPASEVCVENGVGV